MNWTYTFSEWVDAARLVATKQELEIYIENPRWEETTKIHDWRNHVPEFLKVNWLLFDRKSRFAFIVWAEKLAEAENWD